MVESRQNPTEADKLYELSPRQVEALGLVLSGMTDGEVARSVGVTRQTVNEWRRRHPAFRAVLTRLIRGRVEALAQRAAELQRQALEVVGRAIDKGEVGVALSFLRLRLETPNASGPDDPEEVLLADLPRRDPLLEVLDRTEAPTAADRERLEASIMCHITQAATADAPE